MSVNPLDRTDQRLIRLVNDLGDPLVETQTVAEEVELGFQETRSRLDTLAEQGWIDGHSGDGQRIWQVTSKAGLLVRTNREPPDEDDDDDIIDAEEEGEKQEVTEEQEQEDREEQEQKEAEGEQEEAEEEAATEGDEESGEA